MKRGNQIMKTPSIRNLPWVNQATWVSISNLTFQKYHKAQTSAFMMTSTQNSMSLANPGEIKPLERKGSEQ
jgi:hypothetical protein